MITDPAPEQNLIDDNDWQSDVMASDLEAIIKNISNMENRLSTMLQSVRIDLTNLKYRQSR